MPVRAVEQIDLSQSPLIAMSSRMRVREDTRDISVGMYGKCHTEEYVLCVGDRTFSRIKHEPYWVDDETFAPVELCDAPKEWAFLTGGQ